MKKMIVIICICLGSQSFAQNKKVLYGIGASVSTPAYFTRNGKSTATGFGMDIKREQFFSRHFAWSVSAGFNYFSGNYSYYKFMGNPGDTAVKNFAFMPVLAGVKYYFTNTLYISAETGALIKLGDNTSTKFALVPSAGVNLPVGKSTIDISIKLVNAIQPFSPLEGNSLKNGSYGYWSLRLAIGF